jgi:(p)ppGpp synthase/HD superfamily hydrolase
MEPAIARSIAHAGHTGRHDRFGEPLIEHIERVARAVTEEARALAFLHDVLEHSDTTLEELAAAGLTDVELAALLLLTRELGESYEAHTLRVAHAAGDAGRLARIVKVADLADHLRRPEMPHGAPPYAWAHLHIRNGQARRDGAHDDRARGDLAAA